MLFRKRISVEMLIEANEYLPGHKDDHHPPSSGGTTDSETESEPETKGTMMIDATCAPANIRYPQDVSLLNEARDIKYLEQFMSNGYALEKNEIALFLTIIILYEQQKYMYDNKTHSVDHRIVSITQPWRRPIVRGKVKTPVEFGAKLDLSIDSDGYSRIEKISFEAYNKSTCLIEAIKNFKERTGYYPERVLADQIYRTRENRRFCSDHGIRLSGPKLGRPGSNEKQIKNKSIRIIRIGLKLSERSV